MKIAIVCDSFKESLTAAEVTDVIEAGLREVFAEAEIVKLPAADGGEGTVAALVAATGGHLVECHVTGPLGTPVPAIFGILGDGQTAVVEMAAAAGLMLVPPERRNPLHTTTRGVGELLLAALDAGCSHVIIGLGGSATNDGGAGFAQALGVRLLDHEGEELSHGGEELARLARLDISGLDPRLRRIRLDVACDVDNPLLGEKGASAVFGPQKGATTEMVATLDEALGCYAGIIADTLGRSVAEEPGAGAAGGMGAALLAFTEARMRPGIEIVAEALALERALADVDLVITGEGRVDGQTVHGKTPIGVARIAQMLGKPVIALAGSLGQGVEAVHGAGIDAVFSSTTRPCTLPEAIAEAPGSLRRAARNVAMALRIGRTLPA